MFQFLVSEWQKADLEWLLEAGAQVAGLEFYEHQTLAALYYLGSTESVSIAAKRY